MPLQPLNVDLRAVRLIATDMDGTLTQAGKFTPALLQALLDLALVDIPVVIVTGRSAGWVQGVAHYLPIAGAIAENGGLFYSRHSEASELLTPIADIAVHRQKLAAMFRELQVAFPSIQASHDNPFRLTDWTFDVEGLRPEDLRQMSNHCHDQGWGFTYSTVQCHIKPAQQNKAIGLLEVLSRYFPQYTAEHIVTVGDSPNDESLFNRHHFPMSVGVANVLAYVDQLTHRPTFITQSPEAAGFCELANYLMQFKKEKNILKDC
ncbi:HAD family hydrolase [Thermocoleostomius sinensis]|uniref:HAD family hydrolase n=1 Tax=Thermocoleostomius sinensis A174 TaxID=2016057 RepID=A0A9E8ZJM9_9CYAN|nr:HAD family hydrolase [Thermocoleostomius sinensis]WAL62453.1 HAD family hydrolase [Thermocoleostomius sinensis A174]